MTPLPSPVIRIMFRLDHFFFFFLFSQFAFFMGLLAFLDLGGLGFGLEFRGFLGKETLKFLPEDFLGRFLGVLRPLVDVHDIHTVVGHLERIGALADKVVKTLNVAHQDRVVQGAPAKVVHRVNLVLEIPHEVRGNLVVPVLDGPVERHLTLNRLDLVFGAPLLVEVLDDRDITIHNRKQEGGPARDIHQIGVHLRLLDEEPGDLALVVLETLHKHTQMCEGQKGHPQEGRRGRLPHGAGSHQTR